MTPSVAPTVAAKQFLTLINTIFTYNYVNMTTDPSKLGDALVFLLTSTRDLAFVANSTGLTFEYVNKTLIDVYLCVNSTLTAKKTYEAFNCFEASPTQTTNLDAYCTRLVSDLNAMVLSVLFIVSLIFVIVVSFMEKRKYRRKCWQGRPGPVVPLNMLDSYENRYGNALAFGVTTSYVMIMLLGNAKSILGSEWGKIIDVSPSYVGILFKIMATVLIAMAAYPLFVCMKTKHKVMGSSFGIFYCILWSALISFQLSSYMGKCVTRSRLGSAVTKTAVAQICGELPQFVCLFILLCRFIYMLVIAIRKRAGRWSEKAEDVYDNFKEGYMYVHVLSLLKGVPDQDTENLEDETLKIKIKKRIYKWRPEFKYSTRVISAFMVSGIALYTLTIYFLWFSWFVLDFQLATYVKSKSFEVDFMQLLQNNIELIKSVRMMIKIWTYCFYAAIILSTFKTILVFLNMLAWYRGHMMRLRRGDKLWLPSSLRSLNASPSSLLAASMKYAGFQVGYAVWGYIMFALLVWIIISVVVSLVLYPLFTGKSSVLLSLIYGYWPALLISVVVMVIQRLTAMFFFLQQRGKIISIDNRNAYHITSYFMFYFNIFLGLISCLLRIIKSVIIGVIFMERVQKSLLPRSFEKMDPGEYSTVESQ